MRPLLIMAIGGLSVACGDLSAPRKKWEQLDEKALNSQFENPTGTLDELLLKQLVATSLEDDIRYASKALGAAIEPILTASTTGDTTGTLKAALTVTSSDAYIRAACPGPDTSQPDVTFQYGQVRFDAPGITPKKASLKDGDVLLTFTDCLSGKVQFKGQSAAYYDTTKGLISTLALELTKDGVVDSEFQQSIRFHSGHVDLLVSVKDVTYVVDVGQLPNSITVTGKDATVKCSLDGSKATCNVNGKSITFDTKAFRGGANG